MKHTSFTALLLVYSLYFILGQILLIRFGLSLATWKLNGPWPLTTAPNLYAIAVPTDERMNGKIMRDRNSLLEKFMSIEKNNRSSIAIAAAK